MIPIHTNHSAGIDRRTFLIANLALIPSALTQTQRLDTLSQWLAASPRARDAALQPCMDRIRSLDSEIHAWVQVLPQKPTGDGALNGIPFGVKDIIETQGLATEYGSRDLQGTHRYGRRGDRSRAAPAGRCPPRQDAHHRFRVPDAGPDSQPSRPGAHPWWQFERVCGRGRRGDGSVRSWYADARLNTATGVLLRRHGIEAQLRAASHGGGASVRQEPRHVGAFHSNASRDAAAMGSTGTFGRPG